MPTDPIYQRYTVEACPEGRRFPTAILRDGFAYLYVSGRYGGRAQREQEAERICKILNAAEA